MNKIDNKQVRIILEKYNELRDINIVIQHFELLETEINYYKQRLDKSEDYRKAWEHHYNLVKELQSNLNAIEEVVNSINIEVRNNQVISIGVSVLDDETTFEDEIMQDIIAKRVIKAQQILRGDNK